MPKVLLYSHVAGDMCWGSLILAHTQIALLLAHLHACDFQKAGALSFNELQVSCPHSCPPKHSDPSSQLTGLGPELAWSLHMAAECSAVTSVHAPVPTCEHRRSVLSIF